MGFGLLAIASLITPFAGSGVPLSGERIVSQDAVMRRSVPPRGLPPPRASARRVRRGAMLWSFFRLALLAWGSAASSSGDVRDLSARTRGGLAAIRRPPSASTALPEMFTLWTMHALALLIVAVGLAAELFFFDSATTRRRWAP
jgi:hypothetical protein